MTKAVNTPHRGFKLGRAGFARISAVEGIRLSPEMEAQFQAFDRENLPADLRRQAIAQAFGKARRQPR